MALTGICLAFFLVLFDATAVNVALGVAGLAGLGAAVLNAARQAGGALGLDFHQSAGRPHL